MDVLSAFSVGLQLVGGLSEAGGNQQSATASRVMGRRKRVALEFEAEQLEQRAGQVFAASQRDAQVERDKADLVASRALALAAASGGGASDPTVVRIIADIKGKGSLNAATALYRGEEEARRIRMGAKARRFDAETAERGGDLQGDAYDTMATSALLKTGATLFSRYGGGSKSGGSGGTLVSEMVPGQFSTVNPSYG